jgi:tetraacyldisaccharide-1-P 4'-kinase
LEQWIARQPPVTSLLCTCKDLVKFDVIQLAHRPLWALAVEIRFLSGQDELETRLRSLVD